jgi:hypothetical protein
MKKSTITFDGNFAFFNDWKLYWSSGESAYTDCSMFYTIHELHNITVIICSTLLPSIIYMRVVQLRLTLYSKMIVSSS